MTVELGKEGRGYERKGREHEKLKTYKRENERRGKKMREWRRE